MQTILIILHVIIGILLILIILLQMGRGASLSSIFGSSSESMIAGPGTDVLLKKITAVLAIIFVITSLSLSIFYKRGRTVFEKVAPQTKSK
ncbi:MAG: preprotein translocase subunit SecG [Caldiserica bacterium]|nr:MAG: preprotein translocase subunit SecG [Caldisericota bacterium]